MNKALPAMICVLLAVCACNRPEEETITAPSERTVLLRARVVSTRTEPEALFTYWTSDDRIGLTSTTGYGTDDFHELENWHYWQHYDNYEFAPTFQIRQRDGSFQGVINREYDEQEKTWYAYYPFSTVKNEKKGAVISSDYLDMTGQKPDVAVYLTIPDIQKDMLTGFDPAADILLSRGFKIPSGATMVDIEFRRMVSRFTVAFLDNTVGGILDGVIPTKVTIRKAYKPIDGKIPVPLVGAVKLNLENQTLTQVEDTQEGFLVTIENPENIPFTNTSSGIYYSTSAVIIPQVIAKGDLLEFTLYLPEGKKVTCNWDMPSDPSLAFHCDPDGSAGLTIPIREVDIK